MNDLKSVRATLLKKIEALESREGRIGKDLRQAAEPDSEERAVALENAEVLQKLDQQVAAEIQLLHRAIQRIDAGTYGDCERCGKAISAERRAALPDTTTCSRCAA